MRNRSFHRRCIRYIVIIYALFIAFDALAVDRRRDQSQRDISYAFMPYAMQIPGIGGFYGLAAAANNMFETESDMYLATMIGDLHGYTGGLFDVPLPNEYITLHYFTTNFSKASVESYGRGMDSKKEDMKMLFADKVLYNGYAINIKAWDKRFQLYSTRGSGKVNPTQIYDNEGNLIADITGEETAFESSDYGVLIDYTDDRADPRKGLRLEWRNASSKAKSDFDPEYYRVDQSATAFLPITDSAYWTFNLFGSDAVVTREGETDRNLISARIGIDCTQIPDATQKTACEASLTEQIDQAEAANRYGTASSLGGINFLRAYPEGRYYAAHTRFYGTEFRWNFNEGNEPFDLFLMKGIRTIFQLALYYEKGTVADKVEDLGKTWRSATGVGFRVLLTSGFVFRLDVGTGEEGTATTLFFNYPWVLLN